MLILKTLALLAAAVLVTGQSVDSLPTCAQNCYYSSRDGFAQCTGADQASMACLCPNADFFNAVHDCASKACQAEFGAQADEYAGTAVAAAHAVCATATVPAAAPPATSAAPANSDAAAPPASTTAPETSAAASSVPSAVSSSTEPTSVPTDAAATSATAPSTAATSTTESSESATSTGAGAIVPVPTGGSSTSSASAPASTSKDKDEDDDAAGGLSKGAKAGIGAGIGVGSLVLLITLALVLFRKRSTPKDHIKISDPVAGGRHYASDPYSHNNFSRDTSHGGITIMSENELEMKSRRYEDMLPRQQPRNMV
ncbi:hypothetical protein B0H65DRAFT_175317 [Neurospora tetraspora]|uniref:CFEM domain-containing protein n=1 Tax=Neurospora tetraspora TaxID=94610 RepID=A0AAE0JJ31_9PEZI|nr:hypothetical protein B0H65DRAFT_175317 [Neurospora tetraspora]